MTTLDLVGVLSLGMAIGILLTGWVACRRHEEWMASPWEIPRTPYIAALRERCMEAAYDHEGIRLDRAASREHVAPAEVLRLGLIRDGVLLFQEGHLVHPDGSHLDFNAAARMTIETIHSTFAALHEAADLLTDYADTFTSAELLSHPSETMRSIAGQYAKYPLQQEIVRVARLLGADANSDGGAELLQRHLRRLDRVGTRWPTAVSANS